MSNSSASEDIMRAWHREGAAAAWQTALLYANGDRERAGLLVAQLDEEAHVKNGILSFGGLTLAHYQAPAWSRVFG